MARVVVIGAGIVGASTAFHLVGDGHDVVLVDAAVPGAATDAGAGIITAVSARLRPSDEVAAFLFAAVAYYADLVARLEELGHTDHGYGTVGQLLVAVDEGEREQLDDVARRADALVATHGARGIGAPELLDGATARRLCPILGPVQGALWLPSVGRVDGRHLRDSLVAAVLARGGTLVRQPASMTIGGGRVAGVATAAGQLSADAVVLAAGAWSGDLAQQVGLHLPVAPQRGQIVHVSLPRFAGLPVVTGFHPHYILSFPGGRIVFGATRETGTGFDYALTVAGIAETIAAATRIAPVLAQARWLEARVGFRPVSPDDAPIVGTTERLDGLVVGTGFGAQGLTLGPYAGAVLARLAVGETAPVPAAFRVDRFGSGP
jgi:D-amino-acid dehydrogenase